MTIHLRGRGERMKDFSIPVPTPIFSPGTESRPSNAACFMWAIIAFCLGVTVGIALPYLVDNETLKSDFNSTLKNFHPQSLEQDHNWNLVSSAGTSSKDLQQLNPWAFLDSEQIDQQSVLFHADIENKSQALIENNIFFGGIIEEALPKGFSDSDVDEWRSFVRKETVVKLHEGCGRMQNRLLIFENGTKSCCRYRQNLDQIQGEIFSFYLSRLLGMTNVPPSALGVVKAGESQWERVGNQLALAQWAEEHPVVLTKFVEGLIGVSIPFHLRSSSRHLHPQDVESYNITSNRKDLIELAQWSDLLIFDYLTANLDRIVNNLYNLQWNPSMMEAPAHNLAQDPESDLLIFLDNESGLLHGYRLLDKYEPFHESLLQSLCVFRKTTANNIRQLVSKKEIGKKLHRMFKVFEPHIQNFLPTIPEKTIQILNERLKRVNKQILKCKNLYMNSK